MNDGQFYCYSCGIQLTPPNPPRKHIHALQRAALKQSENDFAFCSASGGIFIH